MTRPAPARRTPRAAATVMAWIGFGALLGAVTGGVMVAIGLIARDPDAFATGWRIIAMFIAVFAAFGLLDVRRERRT
ncbi:MAG: hypothetical protein ABL308_12850 [Oceanicaulis sp.]